MPIEISDSDISVLRHAIDIMPPGIWEVWTSNSYRRLTSRDEYGQMLSNDGNVLHGTRHSDGQCDLSMSEMQLKALCTLRNGVLAILKENDR